MNRKKNVVTSCVSEGAHGCLPGFYAVERKNCFENGNCVLMEFTRFVAEGREQEGDM